MYPASPSIWRGAGDAAAVAGAKHRDARANNFEIRMKIANFTGYIIPGIFGLTGFYDVGRVWVDGEKSDKWHSGVGGGVFFAPAQMVVVNVVAGYSDEGWLPYVTMGFRF